MNSINLADIFVGLGRRHVNRPALVSGERRLSFEGLVGHCAQIGHALAADGVAPGQNVGLAFRDGFDTITYMIALWMIDAVAVPLEFRSRAEERVRLAEDFDLVLIAADTSLPGAPYASVSLDGEWREIVARQSTAPPREREPTTSTAMIALTSGTTGRPLGLVMEHAEVLLRQIQQHEAGLYFPSGVHFNATPMSFSASRTQTIARLCEGCTVHFFPSLFGPEEFAGALNRVEATYTFVVPTVVRSLLDFARTRPAPLFPKLRTLHTGGATTQPHEKQEARALLTEGYTEVYGSSIAGIFSVLSGSDIDNHADTVGRILGSVRLEVVDDRDRPLPTGETGIIRLRTASMASATYKGASRASGDRLKDGWVYPGDLGSVDGEGYLRILGRTSEVIIRGGANVHPSEIESVIAGDPRVKAVAVLGYAAAREGEEIAAFVVGEAGLDEAELVALARAQLAPDKRPRRFILVDALPLTAVGKLDRAALLARLAAES